MCTLFLLYKYARCESQQKKIGHVWIFKVLCDLCTRECGVVFVANSLCTWVINSRPLTHVNLNPNKECTPSPENNYDLSNIQDTPINLHTWLIKQITLHIIGGGGGGRFESAPPRTLSWITLGKKHAQTSSELNHRHSTLQANAQLYEAMLDPYQNENNRWRVSTGNML